MKTRLQRNQGKKHHRVTFIVLIISLIFLVILGLYLYRQTQQKATITHPKTSQARKTDKKIKTKPKTNHDATNKNIPTNKSTSNQAIPEAMQGNWYPADDENISGLNGYLQINNETLTWTITAPQQEQGTYIFKIDRDGTSYNLTPQGSAPFKNSSYLVERQDADTITLAFHGGTARFSKNKSQRSNKNTKTNNNVTNTQQGDPDSINDNQNNFDAENWELGEYIANRYQKNEDGQWIDTDTNTPADQQTVDNWINNTSRDTYLQAWKQSREQKNSN